MILFTNQQNKMEGPIAYLNKMGYEVWKFHMEDRRVVFKKGEGPNGSPIGEYTGLEATHGGTRDVSPQQILEEFIRPIIQAHLKQP